MDSSPRNISPNHAIAGRRTIVACLLALALLTLAWTPSFAQFPQPGVRSPEVSSNPAGSERDH
jgi:hypothetical protein